MKGDRMDWRRILTGKISFHYFRKQRWNTLSIDRYWYGRVIYFGFSKISFQLDCRVNWVEDMITGKPK